MLIQPIKVNLLSKERQELFPASCSEPVNLVWMEDPYSFFSLEADIYIDFDFDGSEKRKQQLAETGKPVIVNSVRWTCEELPPGTIRINGWPGFTHPDLVELAWKEDELPKLVISFLRSVGKKWIRVPDTPGMIRPRLIAMIINEAWLALQEGISSKEEMDTAMKLGTNYPLGPFEWTSLIGEVRVLQLLQKLAEHDPAYTPSSLLEQSISHS